MAVQVCFKSLRMPCCSLPNNNMKQPQPSIVLKDPGQPPPFSMPSKLLTLHGEVKSYCFTVSCAPGVKSAYKPSGSSGQSLSQF